LYTKNGNLFLILFVCFSMTTSSAKDLGVYGETFPIAEENLLQVIQNRLKTMAANGELIKAQQELAQKATQKIRRPAPVKGLIKTQTPRQWFYDPSITVEQDIKDPKGNLIAAKGQVINPLEILSWGAPLLFLDGDDPEQIAWAEHEHTLAKWVLIKGSPVDMEEKLKRPVYFDQAGMLTGKFGIRAVPCRISQKDKKLLVEEISITTNERMQ
jgi:conjugal transfer pilus assembly protein TraW